jgi:flagellar hook-basal body complex protein FliE
MSKIGGTVRFSEQLLGELRDAQFRMQESATKSQSAPDQSQEKSTFLSHLIDGVQEVNQMQVSADQMAADLAAGKNQNIHEIMLAATKAELGFNFMVQIRNKAIEAYQEIMRMQV